MLRGSFFVAVFRALADQKRGGVFTRLRFFRSDKPENRLDAIFLCRFRERIGIIFKAHFLF